MFRFLLGDDVFISYARRDGAHYAAALASRLGEPEFDVSCFLDQWGASAASELSRPVLRALRRSYVLVLIGTPGAVQSAMVRREVAEFSRSRFWRKHRPILPINVAGALETVSWTELTGLHRIPETHDACVGGLPSERVIRLIKDSYTFSRRSQRTRLVTAAAAFLLAISTLAAYLAYKATARATQAVRLAETEAAKANAATAEAQRRAKEAQLAELKAKESEAESLAAREEAERQTRVAVGRQRAAEAGVAVSRGNRLPEGIAIAIEAMRSETVVPIFEGYQVLRQGLSILAHLVAEVRHPRPIRHMSLSADARYIATANELDGTVQVWDTRSGRMVAHKSYSRGAAFLSLALSPGAEYLAVTYGGSIDTFDLRPALGGESVQLTAHSLRPAMRAPRASAFSPDGRFFGAVGYAGGMARIWAVDGWKHLGDLSGGFSTISFSPDGKHMFAVNPKGTQVHPIAAKALNPKHQSQRPAGDLVAFSSDGTRLVTADAARTIRAWHLSTSGLEWEETARFTHHGRASALAISSSGAHVAVVSEDGTARIWNTRDDREVLRLTHNAQVTGVAFSRDGAYVATTSEDATTRLWSTREDATNVIVARRVDARALAFSHDSRLVRAVTGEGRVRAWDASSGAEIDTKELAAVMGDGEIPYLLTAAALSADGRRAALAISDGTVFTGDTESGESTEFSSDREMVAIDISLDGRLVAGVSDDGIIVWRSSEPGKATYDFKGKDFRGLAFSADGRLLAAGGQGVRVWEISNGLETRRLPTEEAINILRFSKDSKRLVAAGTRGDFFILELSSGAAPVRVRSGLEEIAAMALSADGRFLALAGTDNTVRVWDATTRRELARLVHDSAVAALAFSPDMTRLALAARDHTVTVSLWRPEDLIGEACKRLPERFKRSAACPRPRAPELGLSR